MTKVVASFIFLLLFMGSSQGQPVGPDWSAAAAAGSSSPREKFKMEHPIFKALSRGAKPPLKLRNRTLIEMSLAIHSIDFDISSGTFKTNGYMVGDIDNID